MFERMAGKILDLWATYCRRKRRSCFSPQLEKELGSLHPGINAQKLVYEFYIKKIAFCILITGAGMGVIFLYVFTSVTDTVIKEDRYLERDAPGGMEKTVVLDAQIDNVCIEDISIPVTEKQLSEAETVTLLEELALQLPSYILGENAALSYIDKPLLLVNSIEQASVSIFWESSDREIVAEDGSVNTEGLSKEGKEVILTANLVCGDMVKEREIRVRVYPPVLSQEEELRQKLVKLLEGKQKDSETKEYLELPDMLGTDTVIWKEPVAELLPMLFILLIICVGAVFWGKDREVLKECEERNKQLMLEYSEFVSKLQLLLCSGMSVRSAFAYIAKEYQNRKKKGGKKQYVCEELLLAVRKMENGMPETEALKFFGERCNLFCYKKIISLILQNLKKGSDGLREAMMNESRSAFEERKQTARRLGEEAGTKLLLPMMLMMGIVLVIIIIPAYFSFGGI